MRTKTSNGEPANGLQPILLVEDNEDDILCLHRALNKAEVNNPLFVIYTGEHAVEYLAGVGHFQERRKYPTPCLVLLNTDLPELSGLEVLEWIRHESNPFQALPVILLASAAHKEELKTALRLKATDYLPKSLNFEQMLELARELKRRYLHLGNVCGWLLAWLTTA